MSAPPLQQALALMVHSIALEQQQQWQGALEFIDAALRLDPLFLPAQMRRGALLSGMGCHEEAAAAYQHALQIAPHLAEAEQQRARALEAALGQANAVAGAGPSSAEFLRRRSLLLTQLERHAEALTDLDALLHSWPADVDARNLRANLLLTLSRPLEALAEYDVLLQTLPDNPAVLFNRANVLQQLLRMEDAVAAYQQVLALQPDFAEARLEQAFCLLAQGDFAQGWPLLEARWDTAQLRAHRLASTAPAWLGGDLPGGCHLLLWAEQGVGDTLQFLRFVPEVLRLAQQATPPARVSLRVPAALLALMRPLEAQGIALIASTAELPRHDLQCPLMSLPLALHLNSDVAAPNQPYIHADTALTDLWRQRLDAHGSTHPRVGLVWAGRQYRPVNRSRDVPLAQLQAALARAGQAGHAAPAFISLQKDIPAADLSLVQAIPQLQCLSDPLLDWADTAALIANLDLVISVDTAVAHLAAAMGKPVWLLLRSAGEWRWQVDRADSPWYPTLRIFRQQVAGQWDAVLADVLNEVLDEALKEVLPQLHRLQAPGPSA